MIEPTTESFLWFVPLEARPVPVEAGCPQCGTGNVCIICEPLSDGEEEDCVVMFSCNECSKCFVLNGAEARIAAYALWIAPDPSPYNPGNN